jgi:hypothetical protein
LGSVSNAVGARCFLCTDSDIASSALLKRPIEVEAFSSTNFLPRGLGPE